MKNTENDLH